MKRGCQTERKRSMWKAGREDPTRIQLETLTADKTNRTQLMLKMIQENVPEIREDLKLY